MKQVAATLQDDKPKPQTTQITKPIQVAKSTSPKQGNAGIKIISIEKKGSKINEKIEIEGAKSQPKPAEEVPVVKIVEKEETKVDGAAVSILSKEKSDKEEEKKETITETKPLGPSIKTDTSENTENITTEQPKVENKLSSEAKQIEIVPNGSISPNEEIIKPEESKEIEVTPPEEDLTKAEVSEVSTTTKPEVKTEPEVETEPEIVEDKVEEVESTEEKVSMETAVNGIESESKSKPSAPATMATEPGKDCGKMKVFTKYIYTNNDINSHFNCMVK